MHLLPTILSSPAPPQDLLFSHRQGVPVEDVNAEVAAEATEAVTVQAEKGEDSIVSGH